MENALTNRLSTLIAAAALFCLAASAPAALAQGLAIPAGGAMTDFPGAHELPDPSLDYKIVFSVESMAASPDKVGPGLQYIAAIVNTYEKHGVAPSHLHITAVFHGPTIVQVVDDATYKGRTGFDKNPNVELLNQFKKAGIQMVVCGQSAMQQKYDFKTILPLATINYSATVTFINLMTRGYIQLKA
jgi:intracellular sulfur oxidation DsrE/DsrF family protein